MADPIQLSISNIAWDKADDEAVYTEMKAHGFTGLELAPTRIFPVLCTHFCPVFFGPYDRTSTDRGTTEVRPG